jgi:hypothetical protein
MSGKRFGAAVARIMVWGRVTDLSGIDPLGLNMIEVRTPNDLDASLEGNIPLVLSDLAFLEAGRAVIEGWLRARGSDRPTILALVQSSEADEVLRLLPFLDDVVLRPLTPAVFRRRLERATEAMHSRKAMHRLTEAFQREGELLARLNQIGVALSAERDISRLLDLILTASRQIIGADAGGLYLVEQGEGRQGGKVDLLRMTFAQNDSLALSFEESVIPLDTNSIAGYVVRSGLVVNLEDAYRVPEGLPFHISRAFDEASGYRTKSLLAVPMKDYTDKVVGVVQLVNKKHDPAVVLESPARTDEQVVPFTVADEHLVQSLASQAAVAVERAHLLAEVARHRHDWLH